MKQIFILISILFTLSISAQGTFHDYDGPLYPNPFDNNCQDKISPIEPLTITAEDLHTCIPNCSEENAIRIAKSNKFHNWFYPESRVIYKWNLVDGVKTFSPMYIHGSIEWQLLARDVGPGPTGKKTSNFLIISKDYTGPVSIESNSVGAFYLFAGIR